MVDGLSNLCAIHTDYLSGNEINTDKAKPLSDIDTQKFTKADMVVIGTTKCKEFDVLQQKLVNQKQKLYEDYKQADEVFEYPLWAIYGNVVVESSIHKGNIKELKEHTKIVWANNKPYILNGDLLINFLYG